MAGYRNRLTHFYAEISEEELYRILSENIDDFKPFLAAIKDILTNPLKHGFTLE
jgi:uncharacterized protein YutE (UPF0331/DUF86 family)